MIIKYKIHTKDSRMEVIFKNTPEKHTFLASVKLDGRNTIASVLSVSVGCVCCRDAVQFYLLPC